MTAIEGTFTSGMTRQDTAAIQGAEGHMVYLQVSEGTNENTGENEFLPGAEIHTVGVADLTEGNGSHQGYIRLTGENGTVLAKWRGEIKTTMGEEGTPSVTFEGRFLYISGTGEFENIKGQGSYTGSYTSDTTYVVNWTGEYFINE
jgi:hypothetical protein